MVLYTCMYCTSHRTRCDALRTEVLSVPIKAKKMDSKVDCCSPKHMAPHI